MVACCCSSVSLTETEGNGEWKKLKGGSSLVREKEYHIVMYGSATLVAGKQVAAGDIGQGEEANEGAGGEGWQVDAGDVEANEGDSAGEQIGTGDVEDSEGSSEDEEDSEGAGGQYSDSMLLALASSIRNMNLMALMICLFLAYKDEDHSQGASEDEEYSELGGGECGQVGEGSFKDIATSSRKRRKDPMIEIFENILQTMKDHCAVANKFMRGEFAQESIKEAMGLAVDCGAVEGSIPHFMASKLFVKAEYRIIFINMTTREGRLSWLNRWCRMEGLLED